MIDRDTGRSPADADLGRLSGLVADLLDSWYDEAANVNRAGLIALAWGAPLLMLTARQPSADDGSAHAKPGSRPPMRLDLQAHVETTLDEAREHADALGCYTNGADGVKALRRLPGLLEATLSDCRTCPKCSQVRSCTCGHLYSAHDAEDGTGRCLSCSCPRFARPGCDCRHREVTSWAGRRHSELATALGYQEVRADLQRAACPRCKRTSSLSVRREAQYVWCRGAGCGWSATGTMAILAAAS